MSSPQTHKKSNNPKLHQQDKPFPKVVFSYSQSGKIELENKTQQGPAHQPGLSLLFGIFWQDQHPPNHCK
jgi:hypothetical protein